MVSDAAPGDLPSQPSLRRMRTHDIRPRRDLGQNFLVDSNVLGVIERLAELHPADVVLEVGGGLGVLSEHLAPHCAHLHVVELDPGLVPALEEALEPFSNTSLHVGDAMKLDLASLSPAPTVLVANLPYGIAAGVILRVVEELGTVRRWVAMTQKEVGVRLAAKPGESAYGVPSVIAQLSCEVRVARAISRRVFHPVPNVDSVLVVLERVAPPPSPRLRALVRAAFAHRRKALARSVELSGGFGNDARARLRAALEAGGWPVDTRAERLGPRDFEALLEQIER